MLSILLMFYQCDAVWRVDSWAGDLDGLVDAHVAGVDVGGTC